ncbi:GNAT family N-acetyltransferase [Acinetobacter equi]|uniref:GNAT family acetyltransferase n=1 Tax=Acinetobacter equi TaxID=1324350 RepID=A0A0N9W0G5_9GAMM|nr:GNAT family N-acetyltransferase [Acinetobacter equi]ALH94506.1 GNAT family acetyltransferase [Acinetobacter equi]
MTTILRKLKEQDYSQWLVLWKAYQHFYQVSSHDELSQLTFNRLIQRSNEMGCFIVENKGQLIGFVHYIYHLSTWTEGQYCYLQDLFVMKNQRAQGLGKQLIEAVYVEAESQKCTRVYWLTHKDNHIARKLYNNIAENVGFIQYRKNIS